MRRMLVIGAVVALAAVACSDTAPRPTVPDSAPRTPVAGSSSTTVVTTTVTTTTTTSQPTSTTPPTTTTTVPLDDVTLALEVVASGFRQPVLLTAPASDRRLFVVDQPGVVYVIDGGDPQVYLDITDQVAFGGERGLLGLAFDPGFATSGVLYVNYTNRSGDTVVASFVTEPGANSVDVSTQTVHLEVSQPASNHNGGNLAFDSRGYLWTGMGDGGRANDIFNNGQDTSTLLGSMVWMQPTADGFDVPPRSAAISTGAARGVWGIGVRNPWRFTFDGDLLYVADVGQERIEEVTVVDVMAIDEDPRECAGCVPLPNFGWPIQEGSECFRPSSCDPAGLLQPVLEYTHSEGCSITGGHVYRGESLVALQGHYFYGDYCTGFIRSFRFDPATGSALDRHEWFEPGSVAQLTSFGVDGFGELYVTSADGSVQRIVAGS